MIGPRIIITVDFIIDRSTRNIVYDKNEVQRLFLLLRVVWIHIVCTRQKMGYAREE